MRIKQISVNGLFGIFDHVIPLNVRDRITIIHAPNGFGKTIILKMLDGLFNSKSSIFWTIPFKEFNIEFNDRRSIEIRKLLEKSDKTYNKQELLFTLYEAGDIVDTIIFSLNNSDVLDSEIDSDLFEYETNLPIEIFEQTISGLERISPRRWNYFPTDEILSLEEIIERFEDILPTQIIQLKRQPKWLTQIRKGIHLRLIESQRLLNTSSSRSVKYSRNTLPRNTPPRNIPPRITSLTTSSTVSQYSSELADIIQAKLTEYGTTSQSLDRTFPARLVQQEISSDVADEQLRSQLDDLEQKRSRLIEVGLLNKDESSDFQIQTQTIDESTKNILSVYIKDVKKKLSVFDEIASKIDLLREIINKKFEYSYKEINFSKEKGFIFTTKHDNKILSPTDLSSGEQHELVLLYELLFKVEPNSLVLIDEPEISLHLGWQVQFLQDLQKITELANIDILMATHSPDIIQDRWDLTVELKGVSQ